jgi:hypothetical protein
LKTSEILNTAADLIEKNGWVGPGHSEDSNWGLGGENLSMCLEGGILAATGFDMTKTESEAIESDEFERLIACPAYVAVQNYLNLDYEIWQWNDTEGRTMEEVIEVLRATAVIEQAREVEMETV